MLDIHIVNLCCDIQKIPTVLFESFYTIADESNILVFQHMFAAILFRCHWQFTMHPWHKWATVNIQRRIQLDHICIMSPSDLELGVTRSQSHCQSYNEKFAVLHISMFCPTLESTTSFITVSAPIF